MTSVRQAHIEHMAKHLPPSASTLRLLDINGETREGLTDIRGDLDITILTGDSQAWATIEADTADAIVAYNFVLNEQFLADSLNVLRPGGRLIVLNQLAKDNEAVGKQLENSGYVRILVETLDNSPGLLIRGEKRHTVTDTHTRIQGIAQLDSDTLDLSTYQGRYVHLLIHQTPNKPVWHLTPDDKLIWQAVTMQQDDETFLLAFSSLPRAVAFMQPAVLAGAVKDINKVGKFSREVASTWRLPVRLNPTFDALSDATFNLVDVDHDTAEAPDE